MHRTLSAARSRARVNVVAGKQPRARVQNFGRGARPRSSSSGLADRELEAVAEGAKLNCNWLTKPVWYFMIMIDRTMLEREIANRSFRVHGLDQQKTKRAWNSESWERLTGDIKGSSLGTREGAMRREGGRWGWEERGA